MKANKLILLDDKALQEINGGSQESYDIGYQIGEGLRRGIMACSILALFL